MVALRGLFLSAVLHLCLQRWRITSGCLRLLLRVLLHEAPQPADHRPGGVLDGGDAVCVAAGLDCHPDGRQLHLGHAGGCQLADIPDAVHVPLPLGCLPPSLHAGEPQLPLHGTMLSSAHTHTHTHTHTQVDVEHLYY